MTHDDRAECAWSELSPAMRAIINGHGTQAAWIEGYAHARSADRERVGERIDLDAPMGVVSKVNPDGSAEVELNDNGKALYGENMKIRLVPPAPEAARDGAGEEAVAWGVRNGEDGFCEAFTHKNDARRFVAETQARRAQGGPYRIVPLYARPAPSNGGVDGPFRKACDRIYEAEASQFSSPQSYVEWVDETIRHARDEAAALAKGGAS